VPRGKPFTDKKLKLMTRSNALFPLACAGMLAGAHGWLTFEKEGVRLWLAGCYIPDLP